MTHEYFQTSAAMAEKLGFRWMDKSSEKHYDPSLSYTGSMVSRDVRSEDIKGKVFLCCETNLPFNIQARELAILQEKNLPLPRKHWKTRMEHRAKNYIFPWKLEQREASDTGHTLLSPVPHTFSIREEANV